MLPKFKYIWKFISLNKTEIYMHTYLHTSMYMYSMKSRELVLIRQHGGSTIGEMNVSILKIQIQNPPLGSMWRWQEGIFLLAVMAHSYHLSSQDSRDRGQWVSLSSRPTQSGEQTRLYKEILSGKKNLFSLFYV